MPLQTIQLTLLQQVQLVLAVEEQVNDLTNSQQTTIYDFL